MSDGHCSGLKVFASLDNVRCSEMEEVHMSLIEWLLMVIERITLYCAIRLLPNKDIGGMNVECESSHSKGDYGLHKGLA